MNKTIFSTGILFGTLAVVFGAFGAHGLKNLISPESIATFNTGVTYQMYHAIVLLVLGSVNKIPAAKKKIIYGLFTAGIFLFSFSIYLLATNTLTGFDFKTIGFVTPIGGLCLILGWGYFGIRFLKD
ncbi:DUF423 domain-containing protein [Cellulophaga sp. L1A9]|uniref:DUF423 domain-containing protein n=1 Tax=Cellulophaga sp. L1A9 TaxID=2686362 RepID=UPI00131D39FD|nr:DUF423 domain-containing protein [Cellulophaga sp. L1A9]